MIFEQAKEFVNGARLHRYAWRPEGALRGGVVLVHGLGDYLPRYERVAAFFAERGFACGGVDFPGHGHSSGQRGHIPSWELLQELLEQSFSQLRRLTGGEVMGLFAHSMGAYVAFEFLARHLADVRFAWLSSPLIQPSFGRPGWLVSLSGPVGKLLPRFPYDTGVRSADCVGEGTSRLEREKHEPFLHHSTTFGFCRELLLREPGIRRELQRLTGDMELLVTHGTEDRVCPYEISRNMFDEIPLARKRFESIPGERHEPLHGSRQAEVFAAAADWMDAVTGNRAGV